MSCAKPQYPVRIDPQSGVELRFLRRQLKVSQVRLAEVAGVDPVTVDNVERHKHRPRVLTMELLWKALDQEAKRKQKQGADTTSWPRCTGCRELLIADLRGGLLCAACQGLGASHGQKA